MIKIEKTETYGWEAAIRGMRNPLNSWKKSDSYFSDEEFVVGGNDLGLMKRLRDAGTDHRKYLRMIMVSCDIVAPLYWWKEFDTYKVGTVANSCSTMHKIQAKEFALDDFSFDKLRDEQIAWKSSGQGQDEELSSLEFAQIICDVLNGAREHYLKTKDKTYWWQMIQLLPSSYNQKRTATLNYEVLANMYKSRKNHKLDEWHVFCDWIETLPHSELITGKY